MSVMGAIPTRMAATCRRHSNPAGLLSFLAAMIMYTSEMPVTVDNSAAYTSIRIQQSTFDPIHDSVNITSTR
jgi:hypothetical protein